jgi:cobalt-zinc-cadmium efflux system protein
VGNDHGHGHGIGVASASQAHRGRLAMALAITSTILVVEVIGGLVSGSLALLADAGHMLTDVAGISLSLFAIWFAARPATPERTFGYYRVEILAAVVNAVLLFGVAAFVLLEAWERLREPPEVASGLMLVVALVGLTANAVSMWLLRRGQAESLNLRGAYLEVFGDLLGSVAVLIAAAVIAVTGFQAADPVASALIGLFILPRTWWLLRDAVDVLLEATPKGVDLAEVRRHLVETPGVADVHDLHAWTITSGMPVLSVHVVLAEDADSGQVLDRVSACVAGHFDVEHSTFQLEQPAHREHEGSMHT